MSGLGLRESEPSSAQATAAAFVRARLAAVAISAYPGVPPSHSSEAYAIQEQAIELWPDNIAGWKVARIPKEWAKCFPEPRLNGPAFSRNIHRARGTAPAVPIFAGGFAAVETEIVIRVRADAPAHKSNWTLGEALDYVGAVHVGIEVASSPLATLNELGPGAVISDFGNNWGIVIGDEIVDWRAVDRIECEAFIDDQLVGAKEVLMETGPLEAFTFTLGACAARNRPLKAGAWITTGMITGVHDIRIGQHSRHVFKGFGEVSCRSVRAQLFE